MNTTSEMQLVPIDKLIPYVNNARTHSPEQLNKLRSSLREFGLSTLLSSTGISMLSPVMAEYLLRKPRISPKCLACLWIILLLHRRKRT